MASRGRTRNADRRHTSRPSDPEVLLVERRLHTRHRARTSVYLSLGSTSGSRRLCKAVNLSATGVFIETSNLGLRKGQHVELAFAINLGSVTKLHRRTAVVAHISRGGTGLLMEAYSTARAG
jgi:hypothetical protein